MRGSFFIVIICIALFSCKYRSTVLDYEGTPYEDLKYKSGAQKIPGRLQCEFYDFGGEGIAYHDIDSANSGSGNLNKSDGTYLNEFRKNEAVDISYTKFKEPPIDNSSYNLVETEENSLYVGWTEPQEWIKYTIDVKKKGKYTLGMMYTANRDAQISLAVNDIITLDSIPIYSTYVEKDSINWRQWHHWNYLNNFATLALEQGIQTLTLHTVKAGNMNFDYIDFELVD